MNLSAKSLLLMSLVSLSSLAHAKVPPQGKNFQYVGSVSSQAQLHFIGTVEYERSATDSKSYKQIIENQLNFIVGPMSLYKFTAVPKGDHKLSNVKIIENDGQTVTISYEYTGTIVVENNKKETYPVYLPINPDKIYASSMVGKKNPCTDEHYQTEGDFWYFWSPSRSGCKLKKGRDYNVVQGDLSRISNSKLSYPEYKNLPDENGKITIHVLFGMDDPEEDHNPLNSEDINSGNYRDFRDYLISKGYQSTIWNEEQVSAIAKTLDGEAPFVENLTKGNIEYRFFYGPTGIDENAKGFHWFYKDAIENASIMMYEGHSGLGGHLDLKSIEEDLGENINFNLNRYQIFFFDSCTSYRYYNTQYFKRKKSATDLGGTKKLDILTNGLSTLFSAMPKASQALAEAFEKAANISQTGAEYLSYQSLAKQIDSENLFGVNGDEDNDMPDSNH